MWKQILTDSSNLLPDFNDYLILNFRRDKILNIKNYLDVLFSESVKRCNGRLRYLGFQVLTPDETLQYIRNNKIIRKKVQILNSTFELVRYAFEFKGEIQYIHVYVPFMVDNKIVLGSTQYYPLFAEQEAGSLHRTHSEIILKVMSAPIMLYRNDTFEFTTNKGKIFKEVINQVRIHQGRRGRSKNAGKVPILLYHLVHMPFRKCMAYYKFQEGEIDLVDKVEESNDYSYIKIKDNIFLKVSDVALNDMYKRRVIASYLMCLNEWSYFMLRDLLSSTCEYYKSVLGKLTYSNIVGSDTNKALMYIENANKHLNTTSVILDPPTQYQLSQIGIQVNNIYDFLYTAFYSMDSWMVDYSPIDLYDKKVGSLDSLLASLVSNINKKLFSIVNAKEEELNSSTVKAFLSRASQMENWVSSNAAFRANPSYCNDNWLITIGLSRFRSLENIETSGNTQKAKGHTTMQASLLKAHPSHLVVESICTIPPSAPVVAGAMNPYIKITDNGHFIKPEWAKEIEHIFD